MGSVLCPCSWWKEGECVSLIYVQRVTLQLRLSLTCLNTHELWVIVKWLHIQWNEIKPHPSLTMPLQLCTCKCCVLRLASVTECCRERKGKRRKKFWHDGWMSWGFPDAVSVVFHTDKLYRKNKQLSSKWGWVIIRLVYCSFWCTTVTFPLFLSSITTNDITIIITSWYATPPYLTYFTHNCGKILLQLIIYFLICTGLDRHHHGYITLAVVLVMTGITIVAATAFFLFRKKRHRLPFPGKSTNFGNPLFFSNEQSQSDVADTNKLVENAQEENPEPVIAML